MAKAWINDKQHPIMWQARRVNISKSDLCNALSISLPSLQDYLKHPRLIRLEHIMVMAGLFGLSCEELVYIILRNKPQLNQSGKWYIEEIRNKHKEDIL